MKWPLQASLPCPSLCHSNNPAPLIPSLQDLCQTINPSASFSSITEKIKLVKLHRDTLALELEVLKLRKTSPDNAVSKEAINGGKSTKSGMTRKKRAIYWTQEFSPGAPINSSRSWSYLTLLPVSFIYGQNIWPQAQGGYAPNLKLLMIKDSSYSWHKHLEFSHSHRQTSLVISPGIWPWYIMMWRFLSSTQISNLLFLNNAQIHPLGADPPLALVRPLIAVSVRTCTCDKVT